MGLFAKLKHHRVDALTLSPTRGSDIPIGLGLDRVAGAAPLVWIEPLDAPTAASGGGLTTPRPQRGSASHTDASHANSKVDGAVKDQARRPDGQRTLEEFMGRRECAGAIPGGSHQSNQAFTHSRVVVYYVNHIASINGQGHLHIESPVFR